MTLASLILTLVTLERIGELMLARRNTKALLARLEAGVVVPRITSGKLFASFTSARGGNCRRYQRSSRGWNEHAQSYFQLSEGPNSRSSFCRCRE